MKAIGFFKCDPQTGAESLRDIDIPKPSPTGRDLLVKIEAVSINPVDVKTRSRVPADKKDATILGFDGAGVVESVGDQVRNFKPGDEVFYAGTLVRPGTYAEYHLVDERIVGPKPRTLNFPEAAAVPSRRLGRRISADRRWHGRRRIDGRTARSAAHEAHRRDHILRR